MSGPRALTLEFTLLLAIALLQVVSLTIFRSLDYKGSEQGTYFPICHCTCTGSFRLTLRK